MSEETQQAVFSEYDGMSLVDMIRAMSSTQKSLEDAKEVTKQWNARYDYLRLQAIPNAMESAGVENMNVEGVGRVGLTADMWITIPAAQREAAYKWLRENGHGDIITNTVNASSMKALAKSLIKDGVEIPAPLIKITPYLRASITETKARR